MTVAVTDSQLPAFDARISSSAASKSGACCWTTSTMAWAKPCCVRPMILMGNAQGNSSSDGCSLVTGLVAVVMTFPLRCARTAVTLLVAAVASAAPAIADAHDDDPEEQALVSLIDAELAFARMGLEQGIRAAFLAHFSEDGVLFEPAPVRLVETWSKRPANPNPKALKLEWEPAQAGIAKSLDMSPAASRTLH